MKSGQALHPAREVHSDNLPELLNHLNCSLVVTTYQAGQVLCIGQANGQIKFGFTQFRQAMGVCRSPTGLALATKHEIWTLQGQKDIAAYIEPKNTYDIAFLTRSSHITGPVMAHDVAWCNGEIIFVNTLCNCLATIGRSWSFSPTWRPPFIKEATPGDCCHLNGLAVSQDGSYPAYVTMHAATAAESQWRENKKNGGLIMNVQTNEVVVSDLSMPHSPRLYQNQLYVLNSGEGQLLRIDQANGDRTIIAELPGYTRGLDFVGNTAIVGLSRVRESAIFGGLSVADKHEQLRCGLALVDLSSGNLQGFCWFETGVEELFAISVIPGYLNPIVVGPESKANDNDEKSQTIWSIPSPPT